MPVLDEYTRECHRIEVGRSITAERVTEVLEGLFAEHGTPAHVRMDNGPEFIAEALRTHLAAVQVETRYVEPGAPWQNGYIESFNATFRNELLDRELFATVLEAEVLSEQYRRKYNTYRPHSALGYQTPSAYATAERDAVGDQAVEMGSAPLPPSPQFNNDHKVKEQKHEPVPALT